MKKLYFFFIVISSLISVRALAQVPTITSFTPQNASSGTTVTIYGNNFTGITAVSFGGVAAFTFNVVSPSVITAVVGSGGSGSIGLSSVNGNNSIGGFSYITAPVIAYSSPQVYQLGSKINNLLPTNTGGSVPLNVYGQTITLAGSGSIGASNGTGKAASFHSPNGISVDAAGNIYLADWLNFVIRKITPAGVVTTIAGTGATGSTNGPALSATFNNPTAVTIDPVGNLYVADEYNHMIRKISSTGIVSTLAGNGSVGSSDGIGTSATFNFPSGVSLDGAGNVYIADKANNLVRKITQAGVVTTLAGNTTQGSADGLGSSATFYRPFSTIVDPSGNVYVPEYLNNLIRKIASSGLVGTLAGSTQAGFTNGTGPAARFDGPTGVAIDAIGNAYIADYHNSAIRKITPNGIVSTLAGSLLTGSNDGIGTSAQFFNPYGVAIDPSSNFVYVSDSNNNLIRRVSITGYTISAALPPGLSFDGTTGLISGTPTSLWPITVYTITAYNSSGSSNTNLSITVNAAGPAITAFSPASGYTGTSVVITGTGFTGATGVSFGGVAASGFTVVSPTVILAVVGAGVSGNVSVTTPTGNTAATGFTYLPPPNISYASPQTYAAGVPISALSPANTGGAIPATVYGLTTTFAGSGARGAVNGAALSSSFNSPTRLATDLFNNAFISDRDNNLIREISAAGSVTTFAGNGFSALRDGTGPSASFYQPNGVSTDIAGNVYVADAANNAIRMISPAGVVTTLAGSGVQGSANGIGSSASFYYPYGVSADLAGNVYVADSFNNLVRKITPLGLVTTLAGSGSAGSANGTGTAASFNHLNSVTADFSGNVFVADASGNLIRKITPAGVVTTIAGTGAQGSTNGTSLAATFYSPSSIVFDAVGNAYIADLNNNLIRKIDVSGNVSTLAGSGLAGSANGVGIAATFNHPNDVQVSPNGFLYVTDYGNNLIRKILLTGFSIDKPLPAGLVFDATTGTITGTPTAVSPATVYTITGYNTSGSSSTTLTITVNSLLAQTIIFPPLNPVVYGVADFGPGATSNNNTIPITYISSNPAVATINANGTVHVIGAGQTSITASQAGNAAYSAAVPVSQILTVTPALVKVTADNQTKIYGAANPVFTATYNGLVNGDTFASLTTQPIIVTSATAPSAVGVYPVTVGGAVSPNYTFSYSPGTLTITPAPLNIAANNQTKVYGSANPVLTLVYTGFVNGDDQTKLLTQANAVTTAIIGSPVGTYPITLSGATAVNYVITYSTGILTVTPAALTITANDATKSYGAPNPIFSVIYSGFVNGDNQTKLSVLPGIATIATIQSPVGIYPIIPSGATSSNYSIIYVNGNLTINPAILTVKANDQTRIYGIANPAFTFIYSGFLNGDDATKLLGLPSAATTAVITSPVGTYPISVSGASALNYSFNYLPGVLTITQASLALNPLPVKTYGDIDFDPGAISPIAIIYSSGNSAIATIVNGKVHITGAGTTTVTVTNGSTSVTQQLIVNPARLIVTANNLTKNYGAAVPVLTFIYSGFVNGDDQNKLTALPVPSTSATAISPIGTYPITINGAASPNYVFTYVAGVLTVITTPRNLTFNAIPAKTYGDADFDPGASVDSGDPIIYSSSNTALATIINGKVHILGAGTVTITAIIASRANYADVLPLSQALVINKAQQTITFNALPAQQRGGTDLNLNITSSSGLPVTLLSSDPNIASVNGFTVKLGSIGTVILTAIQPGNANYLPATVTQTLTVNDLTEYVVIHPLVTPNGDGINDVLLIEGIDNYPDNKLTVVNLNGVKVFEAVNYDNHKNVFEGHSSVTGVFQPQGTYYYSLQFKVNGESKRKVGYIVLKY